VAESTEDKLVAQAFDQNKHDELARAIEQLTPEEAQFFIARLEAAVRKRKIQLTGYIIAMGVGLVGVLFAFVYFGIASGFTAWVFLAPFAAVGLVLYVFGKWSERVGRSADAPTKR
jgi:hypothetical protein